MRQNIKNKEYFLKYFDLNQSLLKNGLIKIEENRVNPEMINYYKKTLFDKYLYLSISSFTNGDRLIEVKHSLLETVNYVNKSWHTDIVRLEFEGRRLNQYILSAYDEMLWMLSLGYLLDISNEDFKKLVDVIDRDRIKDYLFEFIIRAKLTERKSITEESYEYGWKLFGKLRQAIIETDKQKAEKLVKDFLEKDWYKEHKDAGWYDSHKSKHDTYFGYWSFETAAVVKIMGLDDSSFIDCQYYPKDLVHSNNS